MKFLSTFVRINGKANAVQCEVKEQEKINKSAFDKDPLYLIDVELPYWEQKRKQAEWHIAKVKFLYGQCLASTH